VGTPVAYNDIRDQIQSILEGDARTNSAKIYVEEEPQFGLSDVQQAILMWLSRRNAPPSAQPLAAGMRTRYHLQISLACVCFNMESFRKACEMRDTLTGNLELVLMANRTLGGKVETSWLEGGELYSARNPQDACFVAIAETTLTAEVLAVNT